jgi:hypothetical protein
MTRVARQGDGFTVEAEILAAAFDIAASEVPALMRAGAITSRFETGTGEDEGRFRLNFFHRDRVFRLVVDAEGRIVGRARFDAPGRAAAPTDAAGAAKNRFGPGGQ